ncbi:MAG: T9SS type A sorting domain-containing protein, partial [Muribaculaceae bacterium]|nr:T9SS type A sorting domain-containing protein [Muribaculaceae bacterium]
IKLEAGDVVTEAAVDGITEDASGPVSVYTMSGLLVGTFDGHPSGLPSGIYIFKKGSSTKKVRL